MSWGYDVRTYDMLGCADTSHVVLESVMHPGQRVGILPNGCVKPPENTYLGLHAQFTPSVLSYVRESVSLSVAEFSVGFTC